MNYNHLSDREFIRYITLTNNDPIVNRLIEIMDGGDNALSDLAEAGMDIDTWSFKEGHESYTPGQYITHLSHTVDGLNDDVWSLQQELEEVREERHRLETRTLIQFIADVNQKLDSAQQKVDHANKETRAVREEAERVRADNRELKNKIDVWHVMER